MQIIIFVQKQDLIQSFNPFALLHLTVFSPFQKVHDIAGKLSEVHWHPNRYATNQTELKR